MNALSQPLNVYPVLVGSAGATASLKYSTSCLLNSVPSWSLNTTVYLLISYWATTSKSPVIESNALSQPLNVYPSLVGFAGATAEPKYSISCLSNSLPSWSLNTTSYLLMLYWAVTSKSSVIYEKSLSQPANVYPVLVGSVGNTAPLEYSTIWVSNVVPS